MDGTDFRPTRVRRTRAEQLELREQAVRASLRLFRDGGYEALSMRKLAGEVGVPPMSLYRYFPTKTHLIRHVWADLLSRAHQHALSVQVPAHSACERLSAYLDAWLQYWLDNRRHYWVVFAIRDSGRDRAEASNGDLPCPDPSLFIATIGELVDACVAEAQLPRRPHAVEATFCQALGFLTGVIGMASLAQADVEGLKRSLVAQMVEQVVVRRTGGLHPDGGSS